MAQGAKGRGEDHRSKNDAAMEAIENELLKWTHSTIIKLLYKESAGT